MDEEQGIDTPFFVLWVGIYLAAAFVIVVFVYASHVPPLVAYEPSMATSASPVQTTTGFQHGVVYIRSADAPGTKSTRGTGILIDREGDILTNQHVVSGIKHIQVMWRPTPNAPWQALAAKRIGKSSKLDVAVIQVRPAKGMAPAKFASQDSVHRGQPVLAVGAPFGYRGTVSTGIVSFAHRRIKNAHDQEVPYIQVDAPLYEGSSGGPLYQVSPLGSPGTVIGINTRMLRSSDGLATGMSFAIPADLAMKEAQAILRSHQSG